MRSPRMTSIESFLTQFAALAWGPPLIVLLCGGGLYLAIRSRGLPLRYLGHGVRVASGRYDRSDDPGDVPHFQALTSALSGTIGLGNIAGVAVAITVGGPGAVFWMWISALLGMVTKFFTCTLAVLYRGRDSAGQVQGGPMYVVVEGLGPRWRPLAILFAVAGLFGTLPVFQANQLSEVVRLFLVPTFPWIAVHPFGFDVGFGCVVAAVVASVVLGGITRIGAVTARVVPTMVVVYLAAVFWILVTHADKVSSALALIVSDAFTGAAVAGGSIAHVITTGIRRGAFSNEAGIGTEAMAHGAAKTSEPVREGLVAMLGPAIDTLVVCTATALAILVTGAWQGSAGGGVGITAAAFASAFPVGGTALLTVVVAAFAISTMVTFAYYGEKCLAFLVGPQRSSSYRLVYVALIVVGSATSLNAVVAFIDGMYALMAIPTMTATLILAPRVLEESKRYFAGLESQHGLQDDR
ncbi:MAG: AGCS family alanine or glycine:cation symporter [Candidatus Binatia bacterium]